MIAENNTLNNQRVTSIINETVIADFCSEMFEILVVPLKRRRRVYVKVKTINIPRMSKFVSLKISTSSHRIPLGRTATPLMNIALSTLTSPIKSVRNIICFYAYRKVDDSHSIFHSLNDELNLQK